jgi:hypothetical protein
MTFAVFTCDFNSGGGFGDEVTDFDGYASAFFDLFVDFGPFVPFKGAAIEPHLY